MNHTSTHLEQDAYTNNTLVAETQRLIDQLLASDTQEVLRINQHHLSSYEAVVIDLDTDEDLLGEEAPILRLYHPRTKDSLLVHLNQVNLYALLKQHTLYLWSCGHRAFIYLYHAALQCDAYIGTYVTRLQSSSPRYPVSQSPIPMSIRVDAHPKAPYVSKQALAPANVPCFQGQVALHQVVHTTAPSRLTRSWSTTRSTVVLTGYIVRRVCHILRYGHSIDTK